MRIYGIGTDIASISRIKKSLKNENRINRLFSKDEVKKCKKLINKDSCLAKRFAAKEAFSKAIGTGISNGISFNEIIVYNIKSGKPKIKLLGNTKKIVKKIKDEITKSKFLLLLGYFNLRFR